MDLHDGQSIRSLIFLALIWVLFDGCQGGATEGLQYDVFNFVITENCWNRATVVVYRQTNMHVFYKSNPGSVEQDDTSPERDPVSPLVPLPEDGRLRSHPDLSSSDDNWIFSEDDASRLLDLMPRIDLSTLRSFRERNIGSHPIDENLLSVPGARLSTGDFAEYAKKDWPKQFVEFSSVGFGLGNRQALLYFGILQPSGRGWFILLERTGGHWTQVARLGAWIE